MNDFLKSLRSNSKDKRFDRNSRRPYNPQYNGNPQYRNNDEVNGNLKRGYSSEQNEKINKLIEEALPEIKKLMESISDSQKRRADAEEKKVEILENIAKSFPGMLKADSFAPAPVPTPVLDPESASPASEKEACQETESPSELEADNSSETQKTSAALDREAVLGIIFSMRENGTTFGKIASYLDSENIPTFSGKGAWHAQTIHRICKKTHK